MSEHGQSEKCSENLSDGFGKVQCLEAQTHCLLQQKKVKKSLLGREVEWKKSKRYWKREVKVKGWTSSS